MGESLSNSLGGADSSTTADWLDRAVLGDAGIREAVTEVRKELKWEMKSCIT